MRQPDALRLPLSEQLSLAALHLKARARTGALLCEAATGFVVRHSGIAYLVTNWHVLAGRNPETNKLLTDPMGVVPVELQIRHVAEEGPERWTNLVEPLYEDDGTPRWREHHTHGQEVDIAVLPLSNFKNVQEMPFELEALSGVPVLDIGSTLSVIGYPEANFGSGSLAIWTNVTIASSLLSDFYLGRPSFLVNGTTRCGQFGSPVIAYCGPDGTWVTTVGSSIANGVPKFFLTGVYSGQIDRRSSEIGIVWPSALIEEVLSQGVHARGRSLDVSELPD